jgi:hypothetical protein
MGKPQVSGAISIMAVATFFAIVGYLHVAQNGYDPVHQLMSELALGEHGELMLFAFLAVASALLALAIGLSFRSAQLALKGVLGFASLCFVGAGVFPLGATTEVHVALVALAFIACGLAMYLLPSCVAGFQSKLCRFTSWGLLAALALSVVLGQSIFPMGIGQRLAAFALLAWVTVFSLRLVRS